MGLGKGFRSKMEKMFSSGSQDPEVLADPPPPYTLPPEFVQAGFKEDDLAILRDYDTVIILDDSGSMSIRWGEACKALSKLAAVASEYDRDGIDVHFLNDGKVGEHLRTEEDVRRLFNQVSPSGPTPLGDCLERVSEPLLRNLDGGKTHRKTNFLVITDGRPTDDAEDAVVQIAKRLDKAGATLSQLGIQFIQIGDDEGATKFLKGLDNDLKEKYQIRDIVDTEPYAGSELTAVRMTKLLIGGINRKVDKSS